MPCCFIDGQDVPVEMLEVHHKWPQAYGGPDTPDNRIYLSPTNHSMVHKIALKLGTGNQGVAKDMVSILLPNQPKKQQKMMELAQIIARAREQFKKSGEIPDADAPEPVDTTTMSLDVPNWVHHRLKTLSQGKGLYKYVLDVLERHVLVATQKPGATEQEMFAAGPPPQNDQPGFFLLDPQK